jgi:hypothetical protein
VIKKFKFILICGQKNFPGASGYTAVRKSPTLLLPTHTHTHTPPHTQLSLFLEVVRGESVVVGVGRARTDHVLNRVITPTSNVLIFNNMNLSKSK